MDPSPRPAHRVFAKESLPVKPIDATRKDLLADGIVVCVRMEDTAAAAEACAAVLAGGLRVLEITLTTPGALALIARFAADERALVGAGTVLTAKSVAAVAAAGGRFALSPVYDAEVAAAAQAADLLYIPGAATPTEIRGAQAAGCGLVKVFPAEALGGPAYLRAVRGPLRGVGLVPTSGPDSRNLADYVAAGAVAVGVGGELFPPGWTAASAEETARRLRAAMDAARSAG